MMLHSGAIASIAAALFAGSVGAQSAGPKEPKDPTTARVIDLFVPGGGQLYAGHEAKGLALLAIAGGGAWFAATHHYESQCDTCSPNRLPTGLAIAAVGICWAAGWITAPDDARDFNQQHRDASVRPLAGPDRLGVAIAF